MQERDRMHGQRITGCKIDNTCRNSYKFNSQEIAGKMAGDPIETASLAAVGWDYNHGSNTATPSFGARKVDMDKKAETEQVHYPPPPPTHPPLVCHLVSVKLSALLSLICAPFLYSSACNILDSLPLCFSL
jgi:hypothetical protein